MTSPRAPYPHQMASAGCWCCPVVVRDYDPHAEYVGPDLMDCEDETQELLLAFEVENRTVGEVILHLDPLTARRRHGRPSVPR